MKQAAKKTNIGFPEVTTEIRERIEASRRLLVASHIDPDGDALGTQLAFAEYLESLDKEVLLVRDGNVPDKYSFLPGAIDIPHIDSYGGKLDVDTVVILECPNLSRIGKASNFLPQDAVIINIDHHIDNADFGHINWLNSKASSVGEMIFEYFEQVQATISPVMAEQLYTALMTDTGRFRFASTSSRTMQIAGELIALGVQPQKVTDLVYHNMHPSSMKLVGKVLNAIEYHCEGKLCVLTMTQDMLEETGADISDSEGIVDFTLFTKGVKAGIFLKEQNGDMTRASLRSRNAMNVADIAARFGGGGHFNAAGCTLELPVLEAKIELIRLFQEALHVA